MENEQLRDQWDYIANALDRIVKRVQRLPVWEQDSEFNGWLENALTHAERRADAFIDL